MGGGKTELETIPKMRMWKPGLDATEEESKR